MQHRLMTLAMTAALALLGSSPTLAAEHIKAGTTPPQAAQQVKPAPQPARPKLVDINSASLAELKTLPGIGDADARRIIAARPYPSKAKLAVDKVLTETQYFALKGRIIAVQKAPVPGKTAGKPNGQS